MGQKDMMDERYMSFWEDGVRVSRQRWDLSTHRTMFNVDSLPLVEASSRLAELLLVDGHRSPGGACRTAAHAKFHIRTSDTAALIVGSGDKIAAKLAKDCVSCRIRRIGIQSGAKTGYSPQMAKD